MTDRGMGGARAERIRSAARVLVLTVCLVVASVLCACMGDQEDGMSAPTLTAIRYSCGGGESGGIDAIELTRDASGTVRLETRTRPWAGEPLRTCVYELDPGDFERAEEIIERNGLIGISRNGMSDLVVLDADLWSITLVYGDHDEEYTIEQLMEFADGELEAVQELIDHLASLAQGDPVSVEVEQRTITLSASGFDLTIRLEDGALADSLLAQMPLTVELAPYSTNEMVFYPPEPLDTGDALPAPGGGAGTVAYFEPWGDVVLYIGDYGPYPGLYLLGSFDPEEAGPLAELGSASVELDSRAS